MNNLILLLITLIFKTQQSYRSFFMSDPLENINNIPNTEGWNYKCDSAVGPLPVGQIYFGLNCFYGSLTVEGGHIMIYDLPPHHTIKIEFKYKSWLILRSITTEQESYLFADGRRVFYETNNLQFNTGVFSAEFYHSSETLLLEFLQLGGVPAMSTSGFRELTIDLVLCPSGCQSCDQNSLASCINWFLVDYQMKAKDLQNFNNDGWKPLGESPANIYQCGRETKFYFYGFFDKATKLEKTVFLQPHYAIQVQFLIIYINFNRATKPVTSILFDDVTVYEVVELLDVLQLMICNYLWLLEKRVFNQIFFKIISQSKLIIWEHEQIQLLYQTTINTIYSENLKRLIEFSTPFRDCIKQQKNFDTVTQVTQNWQPDYPLLYILKYYKDLLPFLVLDKLKSILKNNKIKEIIRIQQMKNKKNSFQNIFTLKIFIATTIPSEQITNPTGDQVNRVKIQRIHNQPILKITIVQQQVSDINTPWGIRDFRILLKKCHSSCLYSCSGPLISDCVGAKSIMIQFVSFFSDSLLNSFDGWNQVYVQTDNKLCNRMQIIGGVQEISLQKLSYTIFNLPQHSQITLSFLLFQIDSFQNNEKFQIDVDDVIVYEQQLLYITDLLIGSKLCGNTQQLDTQLQIKVNSIAHTSNNVIIKFYVLGTTTLIFQFNNQQIDINIESPLLLVVGEFENYKFKLI